MIIFNKYEKYGDYHWKDYARGDNDYALHVDHIVEWIGADTYLLDVGAGDGLIASRFSNCIGVDDNLMAISLAAQHDVDIWSGSAYSIPILNKQMRAVLFGDVLEHLEFPGKALLEARRVLDDSGSLYIAVPPLEGEVSEYHYREYTEQTLKESVELFGFALEGEIKNANGRLYARFSKVPLKIGIGGGRLRHNDGYINIDICDPADIKHDCNNLPLPFEDDSVDRVYSSHCLEHLDKPMDLIRDLARVCRTGATIEIKVPYYAAEMANMMGHKCSISLQEIRNVTIHFPKDFWRGDRRIVLTHHALVPSEALAQAKDELPFLEGLDDQVIMRWVQGTCHEICYYFQVVENEFAK